MTSSRPYLIRAIYEWVVDNSQTPYLLVDANDASVQVPHEYVQDGRIVLNVSPSAVAALDLGNEYISFSARFGGSPQEVFVPVQRVMAVYARENGQGMMFTEDDDPPPTSGPGGDGETSPPDRPAGGPQRPTLKVVK
ncbi:ClpXP protease specificity-enhancing factor [Acidihalobacter ferrooxydans]|uniref:ClpXP protease specificity-enhancing factor n=1 Tax=Acidihalobacter ferrooxydans TaxID=1765967 RepID=A0A1P8UI94_9GAMM|nr:ClpXP protease specificity-enhancing factor [Acidihalobacter ferrooxydans]APZ43552.1 ClpXP protease specificity-enhancing factor [Acidihalobacter ferrooxydans]